MSLKLKTKNLLFRILNILPHRLADGLYHKIQDLSNRHSIGHTIERALPTYKELEKITKHLGFEIKNKRVVEIGSGWLPIMPYFFKYIGGVKSVATYDLNKHFKKKKNLECKELFEKMFSREIKVNGKYALPSAINYFPNTNIVKSDIRNTDLVFSRFVLEHVSPRDLREIHQKLRMELQPGTLIIHFISPSDHRAYVDQNLSLQDFLKYSQKEWDRKQTRFDYHNRWRLPQYTRLFEELGYEIVYLNHDLPEKRSIAYKRFTELRIHEDFEGFTEEELTAGSIEIVLKV